MKKLSNCTPDLADKLGFQFQIEQTGSRDWVRVFVLVPEVDPKCPLSIARLSYCREELTNLKMYSDNGMWASDDKLYPFDFYRTRLRWYLLTNSILTDREYEEMVKQATQAQIEDLRVRTAKWKALPPKIKKNKSGNGTHLVPRTPPKQRSIRLFLDRILHQMAKEFAINSKVEER